MTVLSVPHNPLVEMNEHIATRYAVSSLDYSVAICRDISVKGVASFGSLHTNGSTVICTNQPLVIIKNDPFNYNFHSQLSLVERQL